MNLFAQFFYESVEYQSFGVNTVTVVTLAALLILFFKMQALYRQGLDVEEKKSVEGISTQLFVYNTALCAAAVPYGVAIGSMLIVISGSVGAILHLRVLLGIVRYRGLDRMDQMLLCVAVCSIPAMIIIPWKGAFYLACSVGGPYAQLTQANKLRKERRVGVLRFDTIVTNVVSTSLWVYYAFYIESLPLMILNPLSLLILISTALLWLRYRDKK